MSISITGETLVRVFLFFLQLGLLYCQELIVLFYVIFYHLNEVSLLEFVKKGESFCLSHGFIYVLSEEIGEADHWIFFIVDRNDFLQLGVSKTISILFYSPILNKPQLKFLSIPWIKDRLRGQYNLLQLMRQIQQSLMVKFAHHLTFLQKTYIILFYQPIFNLRTQMS